MENGFLQSTLDYIMPTPGLCRVDDFAKLRVCILNGC